MKQARKIYFAFLTATLAVLSGITALCAQQPDSPATPANPPAQHTDDSTTGTPQPAPAPQGQKDQKPAAQKTDDPAAKTSQPTPAPQPIQNDRLFFALPNVLTVENVKSLPPMTVKEKFKDEAKSVFDPVEFVFVGVQAGIGQADDTNPTYGQGLIGYSKRFGTTYADTLVASFNTAAIWPSILHQDPRYYQMGSGNPFRRIYYSAMRVAIARSDRTGGKQFNYSELIGNSIAAGLSNTYHPGPHTIIGTANVLGAQMLVDVIANETKEFWPDLHRALTHKRH